MLFEQRWRAATNHCCGPSTVPIPIYYFTSVPGFVMDSLFVNSLLRSARGWGLCCFSARNIWAWPSNVLLSQPSCFMIFFSYFHYLLFFWFIMESQFDSHGHSAELFTYQCEHPSQTSYCFIKLVRMAFAYFSQTSCGLSKFNFFLLLIGTGRHQLLILTQCKLKITFYWC